MFNRLLSVGGGELRGMQVSFVHKRKEKRHSLGSGLSLIFRLR